MPAPCASNGSTCVMPSEAKRSSAAWIAEIAVPLSAAPDGYWICTQSAAG